MHAQRFPIIPNIPTWGIGSWPKWRKWGFSTRQKKESGWIIDLELISWSVKTIIWPPKCISFSTSVLPTFRKPWSLRSLDIDSLYRAFPPCFRSSQPSSQRQLTLAFTSIRRQNVNWKLEAKSWLVVAWTLTIHFKGLPTDLHNP